MRITLFSDAGLCPRTRVSSWGVWMRSERGIVRYGGIFKKPISPPNHSPDVILAEVAAAINGVVVGISSGLIQKGDHVLIQTDNAQVGNVLTGWKPKGMASDRRAYYQQTSDTFAALLERHGFTHEWRHVKGHKGNSTPRNAVNTYADQVASFYLKLGRHQKRPDLYKPPIWIPRLLPVTDDIVQLVAATEAEHQRKVADKIAARREAQQSRKVAVS